MQVRLGLARAPAMFLQAVSCWMRFTCSGVGSKDAGTADVGLLRHNPSNRCPVDVRRKIIIPSMFNARRLFQGQVR